MKKGIGYSIHHRLDASFYRARHAAELYDCTDWARNECDGSVTVEILGAEEAIDKV